MLAKMSKMVVWVVSRPNQRASAHAANGSQKWRIDSSATAMTCAAALTGTPVVEDALTLPELIHQAGFSPAETDQTGRALWARPVQESQLNRLPVAGEHFAGGRGAGLEEGQGVHTGVDAADAAVGEEREAVFFAGGDLGGGGVLRPGYKINGC
mgnify:CR=1 FL=1